jgi:hypothetical protein
MFRLSLIHLQALMIQIHTKKALCIVGSPMLTISIANNNENMYKYVGVLLLYNDKMLSKTQNENIGRVITYAYYL